MVLLGQYAAHHILINHDAEDKRNLLGDPPAAKAWIVSFHLNDGSNQLGGRSFRTRLSTVFRRKQQSIFALHEGSMKADDGRRFQHDSRAYEPGRAHEASTQSSYESVHGAQVRRSPARTI